MQQKVLSNISNLQLPRLINGNIEQREDIDLYKATLDTAGKTTFDAKSIARADGSGGLDINMFIFNALGNPLASIEPRDSFNMKVILDTLVGSYFIGIGSDDLDAVNAIGQIIAGNDSGLVMPKGVFANWSGPGTGKNAETFGAYSIAIATEPNVTAVPTPALWPGLIGFGVSLLRRKKAATSAA
jgi:hypothetical protein